MEITVINSLFQYLTYISYKSIFQYRLASEIISDDRKDKLKSNREALKDLIKLNKTIILDRLLEDSVITQQDNHVIQVRLSQK